MPKRLKKAAPKRKTPAKPKRPSDPNRAVHQMIAEHMARSEGETEPQPEAADFQTQYRVHMAKLGAKGGAKGGKRRMVTMTQEQRSEIALRAARARWGRAKKR